MKLLKLYARVLGQLGPEKGLGIALAIANLLLAMATFLEPILFGRIVNALIGQGKRPEGAGQLRNLSPLIMAWIGVGLATIGFGVFVALHADRLAHRRRLAVMANYFEHALDPAHRLPYRDPFRPRAEGDA